MVQDDALTRMRRMVGEAGVERLRAARVAVIGLGAVGGYATEAMARSGVGYLRLVDFDEVRESNFNRQLYALRSTLGKAKVEAARERVLDINQRCNVEAVRLFVHRETVEQAIGGKLDLVIDAIDSLGPKIELLATLRERGMGMVTSMGAALRTDPGRVRAGRMEETNGCPLAFKVRKALRKRKVPLDFPCVYSTEPLRHLPEGVVGEEGEGSDDAVDRGRKRRPLGSLPTLTAIFGMTVANVGLRILLGELFPGAGADGAETSEEEG